MTREETISILEESKRQNEIMRDNPSTFWASHQMAEGIKNAKRRIEAFEIALTALRPVSREQVEKVWRSGEWHSHYKSGIHAGNGVVCSECDMWNNRAAHFCPSCGVSMTDETVEMVMGRMEALYASDT